jgi:anaerobic selenocysteine-containing dehydrogenase
MLLQDLRYGARNFINSIFANVPAQLKRAGPPTILIHPEDAASRRLETGDSVRVFNDRGSFVAVAEITDRVRKGVIGSAKGSGRATSQAAPRSTPRLTTGTRTWAPGPSITITA